MRTMSFFCVFTLNINQANSVKVYNDWNSFTFFVMMVAAGSWRYAIVVVVWRCYCASTLRCNAIRMTFSVNRHYCEWYFEHENCHAVCHLFVLNNVFKSAYSINYCFCLNFIVIFNYLMKTMHRLSKIFHPSDSMLQKTKGVFSSKNQSVSRLQQPLLFQFF